MSQLSPSVEVIDRKCDAALLVTWHPEHAAAVAPEGLIKPCGFTTLFSPIGSFASEPFTWHSAQFRVSFGDPLMSIAE